MNKDYINSLLYGVPSHIDYTDLPEDMDIEDIPLERIENLKQLLACEDNYIDFQASRLLTSWGIEEGFNRLKELLFTNKLKGLIQHRLHGYDETYKYVLDAFISYWVNLTDLGKGEEARRKIFEPISMIIQVSNRERYQISNLFWLVSKKNFFEYIPLLKDHFLTIIKDPENNYWRIHDIIELFLKIEPTFVNQVLIDNGSNLSDYGL